MYGKTESEISINNKMSEKNNINPLGKDGSIFPSSVDNANNLQTSYFYSTHPRWINLPLIQQTHSKPQQKICITKGCIEAAAEVMSKVDLRVDPCDDFYQFACGNFIRSSVIPDDKGQVSMFSKMNDKLSEQVRLLLEEPPAYQNSPYQLVRDAYQACMDQERIERLGVTPLINTLNQLGVWPGPMGRDVWSPASDLRWYDLMYRLRAMGLSSDILINFSVTSDLRNSSRHIMTLDQPELGLAREFLTNGPMDPVVMGYKQFMMEVLMLLGVDPPTAQTRVEEIVSFEMKLANITMPREMMRDPNRKYNPMTVGDLGEYDADTPWLEYITSILGPENGGVSSSDMIVVSHPQYVLQLRNLLNQTPINTQVSYIIWRLAAASLSYLNEAAEDIAFKFTAQLSGLTKKPPRWQKCVGEVTGALGPVIGSMYVQRYFSKESKHEAVEMVDTIRDKFLDTLDNVDWMDDLTKRRSKDKAAAMKEYIGYPHELTDMNKLAKLYEGLDLSAESYVDNGLNLSKYHMNYAFSKLRKVVDKDDWVRHGNPAIVNAFYSPVENSIQFPAGILQGVFFNSDRPKYMNYGAIGWVIGHEITHGFDDQGRQFDKDGNLVNWWDEETARNYLNKAQCMVNQYGQYSYPHLENIKVNGINTLGENIADNGGIKTSYQAYKQWASTHGPEPMLPGLDLSPEQMFWVSGANVWCAKHRPGDLRMSVMLGTHTPSNYRIQGTYSNLDDFARDFKCAPGTKMNPHKHEKCRVW